MKLSTQRSSSRGPSQLQELFKQWIDVEYHSCVVDVVDAPLLDDEAR